MLLMCSHLNSDMYSHNANAPEDIGSNATDCGCENGPPGGG